MIKVMDIYNAVQYINPYKILRILPYSRGSTIQLDDNECVSVPEDSECLAKRCDKWFATGGKK